MYTWRALNDKLGTMSEAEVLTLLEQERREGKRLTMLARLHQRYTTLRAARERAELLAEAKQ
jgi:hypothetical protein